MREWINIINESILFEGRDAPLYHGTSLYHAIKIIIDNTIKARSFHDIPLAVPLSRRDHPDQPLISLKGVSFSRLRTGALNFGPILFVVDQNKISQNRKLYPIDFWHRSDSSRANGKSVSIEAEEFLIGSLTNLDRYLLAIEMSQSTFDKLQNESDRKTQISGPAQIPYLGVEAVLMHPKLKIINILTRFDYP